MAEKQYRVDIDLMGNEIKNVLIHRLSTAAQGTLASNALPSSSYTANDVLSKLLTVDGHNSGLDADTLDGNQLTDLVQYVVNNSPAYKYILFDSSTSVGWKAGSGLIFTQYLRYGTNGFGVYNSYDCMELFECDYTIYTKADIDTGVVYPNPVNTAKIAKRNIWTDSPDVVKYKHKLTEGIFGSLGAFPANTNLSTWLNTTSNGVAGYALKNCTSIFTDLSGGAAYYLNLTQIVSNMKMGMNYTFVGRAVGAGAVTFEVVDSRGSASTNLTTSQIISFDFIRIATGIVLYRNYEVR